MTLYSLDMLDTRLRPLCDAYLAESRVPGASVAIIAGGRSYHLAYGVKSIATGEPVTANTSFNIGSCSKSFASATFAALVGKGLADWDDPVSKWVPEFKLPDPEITKLVTFRDLSGNRVGIPQTGYTECYLDPRFPAENIFNRMQHQSFAFPFRSRFGYLNAGHTATAMAAGRITGKGFLATLREHILTPLGMTGTSGGAATTTDLADRAAWNVISGSVIEEVDPVYTDQYLGAGGMSVSGRDALQWLRLHLGKGTVDGVAVIGGDALSETHRPQVVATPGRDLPTLFYPKAAMAAYALGWAVYDIEGHRVISHAGGDIGIMANMMLLPDTGIGIMITTNSNGGGFAAVTLCYALAGALLGLPARDWDAHLRSLVHMPSAPPDEAMRPTDVPPDLAIFAGTYSNPVNGPIDLRVEDGQLVGHLRDGYRANFILKPVAKDRFTIHFDAIEMRDSLGYGPAAMSFVLDDGHVTSAEISGFFHGHVFVRSEGSA